MNLAQLSHSCQYPRIEAFSETEGGETEGGAYENHQQS